MYTVQFDLNYNTDEAAPQPVTVPKDKEMALSQKPLPERSGYRFAGWYEDRACTKEWLFGAKTPEFMKPPVEWMPVTRSMTLYARWAAPVPIRTAEELDAVRKDLYGWYVLYNDIDLSSFGQWQPIGNYEPDYEYADAEWWVHAFKGRLDGNGHTISRMRIEGAFPFCQCGLFGAISNGEVHNLVISAPFINVKGAVLYAGTVAGMMRQDRGRHCILEGICVKGMQTCVEIDREARTTYISVAGLIAGVWDGTIQNCQADGRIKVRTANRAGGILFAGGLAGESYSQTDSCSARVEIDVEYDRADAEGEQTSYIGGLQAGSTYIKNSLAEGSISVSGDNGSGQVAVGGLAGSERYGIVSGNTARTSIQAKGTRSIQAGGILGEYNFQYAVFGMMQGVTETVLKDNRAEGTFHADNVGNLIEEAICGSGAVPAFEYNGMQMKYIVENG
ncbi:MAG: InlB B-repeat-containing protein [Bacteroidales bacterium]|nr:InlB B-repeat-containing protein [Bacteroidales bacterium]